MRIRRIGFPQIAFAPDGPSGSGGSTSSSSGGAAPSSSSSGASPSPAPSTPAAGSGGQTPSSPASSAGSQPVGASPSPSPSPAPAAGTAEDGFFEFPDILGDDEEDNPTPTSQAGAEPPAEGQPTTPPAEQQPPAPGEAAQTPPQQPQAPAPQGPQEATASFPTPAEPGRIAESLQANADALISHLAENEFKLSQADIEALEADAPKHIPQLLARTFFKMQVNLYKQMGNVIPAMLQRHSEVTKRSGANEAKFYAKWPDLKPELHGELVKRYARVYRQANPQATFDQMAEELGPMIMIAAKVTPSQQAAPGAQPPAMRPAGARPPAPFRPAVGGGSAPQPAAGNEDPWAGLAAPQEDED